MAGILKRFTDIMSANINALLDKAEDPEKMIDQYLREAQSDLGKVKAETAAVMAEEKRAARELDECKAEAAKMQSYAEKALIAGNENDARTFLAKKASLTEKQNTLEQSYRMAADHAAKMRNMHDKLVTDINDLNARRDAIKAKMKVARTQQKLNELGASANKASDTLSAFGRMEAKANRMLDEANAMAELNESSAENDIDDLMSKYDSPSSSDPAVDDEMAALKAKLGL